MAKYLAIGSAINVLLVVAIAWCVPEPIGPPDSVRQLGKEEAQAWPGPVRDHWPKSPWEALPSADSFREVTEAMSDQINVKERRWNGLLRSAASIASDQFEFGEFDYTTHEIGFPIPVARYDTHGFWWYLVVGGSDLREGSVESEAQYSGIELPVARQSYNLTGRWQPPPTWLNPLLPKSPRALPLMPLWRGMVMNAIVWATTAWAFVSLARRRWRHRRSRRGLCVACAYPVRGFSSCPECGRAVIE